MSQQRQKFGAMRGAKPAPPVSLTGTETGDRQTLAGLRATLVFSSVALVADTEEIDDPETADALLREMIARLRGVGLEAIPLSEEAEMPTGNPVLGLIAALVPDGVCHVRIEMAQQVLLVRRPSCCVSVVTWRSERRTTLSEWHAGARGLIGDFLHAFQSVNAGGAAETEDRADADRIRAEMSRDIENLLAMGVG